MMAAPGSFANRVGILEEKMGKLEGLPEAVQSLTAQVSLLTSQVSQFTTQVSQLTTQVSQLSTRMDGEFSAIRKDWDAKLETRFREQAEMLDERFALVNKDLLVLRKDVGTILEKLDARA